MPRKQPTATIDDPADERIIRAERLCEQIAAYRANIATIKADLKQAREDLDEMHCELESLFAPAEPMPLFGEDGDGKEDTGAEE